MAFVGLFACCGAAQAACEVIVGSTVTSGQFSPRLDNRATAAEITERAETVRPGFADGITFVALGQSVELEPAGYSQGCKAYRVTARLLVKRADIYLANELEPESCRWNSVLNHELRHIEIAQRAIDAAGRSLRVRLVNQKAPLPGGVTPWLNTQLAEVQAIATRQMEAGDKALDTNHEASKMERECGGPTALSLAYRSSR